MSKAKKQLRAQTAMELAVFGAILIFVIGVIVRQALNAGYAQNQYLRAMRQAMTMSYKYSRGDMNKGGIDRTGSHQTATILFIEDRLTAESGKYSAIDRTPYIASASATYSATLFRPLDADEDANLPTFDMFINGKQFPFTTARFKTVELARSCKNDPSCPPECKGDCSNTSIQFYPPPEIYPGGPAPEWEDNCLKRELVTPCYIQCEPGFCDAAAGDCDSPSPPPPPPAPPPPPPKTWTKTDSIGCAKLYDVVYNHAGYVQWCDDEPGGKSCSKKCEDECSPVYCSGAGDCDPGSGKTFSDNLTADERFDLDRNNPAPGLMNVPPDVLPGQREDFSWQWFLVMGYDAAYGAQPRRVPNPSPPPAFIVLSPAQNTLMRGAGISSQHASIDVDRDLKREKFMVDTQQVDPSTGIITGFVVMDMEEGDMDFSRGDSDPGPPPGLTKDTKMYTFVRDGTYLLLEEGRLYDPDDPSQFIRTAQKKDQIDLIERLIRFSNDTDRFCDSSGNVNNDAKIWPAGLPNPIEACGDCFSSANIQKTCMNEALKLIYVRSRVVDRRGRKWITNTSSDAYVDFMRPAGP